MPTAKYEEPPLNEVVMGVSIAPIVGLHTQHIGRFWEKIASKYPKSEQAENYGKPLPLDKGEIYPGPRFGSSPTRLINSYKFKEIFSYVIGVKWMGKEHIQNMTK